MLTWRQLNDIHSDRDYYFVDINMDTQTTNFNCADHSGHCGPWIANRYATTDWDQYNDAFHRGHLYEYGPEPDPSWDSQTITTSIGVTLNSASVGGYAGIAHTVTKPSVKFHTERQFQDGNWVRWREEFRHPSYSWYPWLDEPSYYAYAAYYTWKSTIGQFGWQGGSEPINGMRAWVKTEYEVVDDQNIRWGCGGFCVQWDRYIWVYSHNPSIFQDISWSSAWLVSPGNGASTTDTTPTLDWGDCTCKSYWYIEIWRSGWGSSAYRTVSDWTTPGLTTGYTYYWRVYSQNSDGRWSVASPTWNFYLSGGGGGGGGPLALKM